jgi:hypothetical protein
MADAKTYVEISKFSVKEISTTSTRAGSST